MSQAPALPPAVVAAGLGRRFGTVEAVRPLDFRVRPGELFGIVGPDGAGKTTTLRMLAGVLPPTSGDATLAGFSVRHEPERVKAEIAYMSQRFGLYDDLTVGENLQFYAELYQVPRRELPARLDRLYHFSNLREFEGRLARDLSGGMRQKLSLSCALVHQPRILLLDEPTFGVDPISRRDLWLILHEMVADGVTTLVSTSYMDEAERCDRVALLHHGGLLALGSPDELRRMLPGQLLAVTADQPRQARDLLRGLPGVRLATLFGDKVHILLDDAAPDTAEIAATLQAGGVNCAAIEPVKPTLEDVFIALVAERREGEGSAERREEEGSAARHEGVASAARHAVKNPQAR